LDEARKEINKQEKAARETLGQQVDEFARLVSDKILVQV
jgi:F0F1-type ATP synthase membrane subunit b/b'